jgi:hypothetical protein
MVLMRRAVMTTHLELNPNSTKKGLGGDVFPNTGCYGDMKGFTQLALRHNPNEVLLHEKPSYGAPETAPGLVYLVGHRVGNL